MTDRALKERVLFKLAIEHLHKCHINSGGGIDCPHDLDDFRLEVIDHPTFGKIWFCHGCRGIIFKGNKECFTLS